MSKPEIEKLLTPYNFTNKNDIGRIKYIVIHYVGALGGAEANCKYYAGKYIGASAHYFVGFSGEIWQSVEDGDIAWHCGAKSYKHSECRNSNSIGIELCVRKEDSEHMGAEDTDWFFEQATADAAVSLTRQLMERYGVPVNNVLRHYDVTGKCCPNPYVKSEALWKEFLTALGNGEVQESNEEMMKITGKAEAAAKQMTAYIKAKNSSVAQSVLDMIPFYLEEGKKENIRGDIAFAQSCLETGSFTFKGSAVELAQNNFCGLGVTKNGEKGNAFDTAQLGIRAQVQHLKAYANTAKLKQECVDPRFKYVLRGCAPYVEHLGIQENPKGKGWAAGQGYGEKILDILSNILQAPEGKLPDTSEGESLETGKAESGVPKAEHPENGWQEADMEKSEPAGIYRVSTTVDSLRIRKGPGTSYPQVGGINETAGSKKKYTILEERNGWGRLKSGDGWIYLWHTKRVV